MKVKLTNVRLAFPDLFKAKAINDGEPRFGAAFPIEPGSSNAKNLNAAMTEAAKEKWGAKAASVLAELKKKGRVCYVEGPKVNSSGEVYDGFEDMHSLQSSSKTRPTVLDRDKTPLSEADGRPYGGCYVDVIVEVWAQDNNFGKRINAQLKGVQFRADGDAFGGGAPASADEFDEIDEEETADDLV